MRSLCVYLIGSNTGQPVKIGVATDVNNRLMNIQTNHPFKLSVLKKWPTSCAHQVEVIVHYELREYRLNGEWFGCPKEIAIKVIDGVFKKTNSGKNFSVYKDENRLMKSVAAQKAGNAYGKKAKARTKAAVDLIKDRWKQPSDIWPTKILLEEAHISLNSVKSVLGSRKIAQINYRAVQKRKAAAIARHPRMKRANNYIDEAP